MIGSIANNPPPEVELDDRLDNESWCLSYAFRLRWPQGFVCPSCGAAHPKSSFQEKPLCRACGRSTSITAGTLLHGSKKSLGTWLRALWWLSGERCSISIMKLKNHLGFSSYQTGWAWMKKLRFIMALANRTKCRGIVLVDSVPVERPVTDEQLLSAIESVAHGHATGRLQMQLNDSLSREAIAQFCRQTVTPGSVIIGPGRAPFTSVRMEEMIYTTEDSSFHHEEILRLCASYQLWRRRNKCRWSPRLSTQSLVDEFCFFHNGTLCTNREPLFEDLVFKALTHPPLNLESLKELPASPGGEA